jgi:NADPH-dependent 2,4-dienoyl-CoA reductase/sulfur reductase-like enzyme
VLRRRPAQEFERLLRSRRKGERKRSGRLRLRRKERRQASLLLTRTIMSRDHRTIAIIGAGPVGLAAAAHAVDLGLTPIVLEAALAVSASARDWGHVRLFSPWRFNIDKTAAKLPANEFG